MRLFARSAGLLLLLASGPLAAGDTLCLHDGRIVDDLKMARVEGGVEIRYENGAVFVPSEMILLTITEDEPEYVPRTDEEKKKFEKGLVPFEGKWIAAGKRRRAIDERIRESRKALEEYRAHRGWANRYSESTKNFTFECTVPRHIFEDYRDKMEAYFQVFKKTWKIKRSKGGKLNVCFYSDEREFHRTSGASSNTLGYFKFVPPYDLNIYFDRLDEARTEDVMFHEANHYLQKLINEGFRYPHWPGEALAEYYGASDWDPETKSLETGLIQEGRLVQVQRDIATGKMWTIREIVATGGESVFEHYSWGWTLVHFLMNDERHAKSFVKFFKALANGKDVERERWGMNLETVESEEIYSAFRRYLGLKTDDDVRDLEAEWHRYVTDVLDVESVHGLEKAAEDAYRSDRKIRARRLFQEAIDAGSVSARTHHLYGKALAANDDDEGAEKMFRRAIELDPLTGESYYALGRLLKEDDAEEGKRLMALAAEVDPDGGYD